MGNSNRKLSVILPMFNEEKGIYENLRSVIKILGQIDIEWKIIVVDDGSIDGSKSEAERALKDTINSEIVSYKPNRGRGFALRAGFSKADGDIIITTESDLSWGADIIPKLLNSIISNDCDVVIASPYIEGGALVNVPRHRRFLSHFGNKILTFGLPDITMMSGMTRAYKKEVLDKIFLSEDGKEIHLEIISKLIAVGAVIREIPGVITWKKSESRGKKKRKDFKMANVMVRHIYYSIVESPFHFMGILGLFFMAIGFFGAAAILVLKMIGFELRRIPYFPVYVFVSMLAGLSTLFFSLLSMQIRDLKREQVRMTAQVIELSRKTRDK